MFFQFKSFFRCGDLRLQHWHCTQAGPTIQRSATGRDELKARTLKRMEHCLYRGRTNDATTLETLHRGVAQPCRSGQFLRFPFKKGTSRGTFLDLKA